MNGSIAWAQVVAGKNFIRVCTTFYTLLNLLVLADEFLIFRGQIHSRPGYRGGWRLSTLDFFDICAILNLGMVGW